MSHHEGGLRMRGGFKASAPLNPLVSVITPVLNGRKHLEATIQSVINQRSGNIEYIIIDGGSTDGTLDIIKKYDDRIAYWRSEPDSGIYDAMNKGIKLARGELIGIINADDYYRDGAIEKIVAAARREPEADVFHADMRLERADGIAVTWHSKDTFSRRDAYHMPINHPTVFIRASCYAKYGVFDTRYKVAADYDLIIRYLFEHNVRFCYVKETLVVMREGGKSGNYRLQTYRDALEILSRRDFSRYIKMRFRIWYVWLLFMQFSKRYKIMRYLSPWYYRIRFGTGQRS